MKIWWPWRKNRPIQLLFEERVPWSYEEPGAPPFRMPSPGPFSEEPHPKNAAGPFYVMHGWCTACGYPQVLAPALIARVEDQIDHHCFFKKQPETPEEIEQAIKAIAGSCCGAFRYAGSDANVPQKLREAGESGTIVQG